MRSFLTRRFAPVLAGASLFDRLIGGGGALIGIGLTGLICGLAFGHGAYLPLLVAPMGASAVLLFAVPASPLAQPWSIIGGNTVSALVGVTVVRLVPDPTLAAAAAVALAIAAMSLLRCLHPPGGAAALTAVLGGPAVLAAGYTFPFLPVGLNSTLLVLSGWLFHRITRRHVYPHVAPAPAASDRAGRDRVGFRPEDVDAALADLGETFDIDRDDVDRLLRQVELRAFDRAQGHFHCSDVMSRGVPRIADTAMLEEARTLLLESEAPVLPVVDVEDCLVGIVGLRELSRPATRVCEVMAVAVMATPDGSARDLLAPLTDGRTAAVMIVDQRGRYLGMVTQADLLAGLARMPNG
jgi:CBS domain-containing membrane protein